MFSILHDLTIKASAKAVYHSITQPEHLNNWWTLQCEGEPNLGEKYRLYFDPNYDWRAIVAKADSHEAFELKMSESSEGWEPTSFGFLLEETEDKTLVRFYHNNWKTQDHHYRRTSYCWALLLSGLKNYLEEGKIIPFSQRA